MDRAKLVALKMAKHHQRRKIPSLAVPMTLNPSSSDAANFINFCTGKDLTNGEQKKGGSCNGVGQSYTPLPLQPRLITLIVMGDIPATTNMVSTIILNPAPGECIPAKKDFTVNLQVDHLLAGVFTNPTVTYYSAPQALKGGDIVGHVHVNSKSTYIKEQLTDFRTGYHSSTWRQSCTSGGSRCQHICLF